MVERILKPKEEQCFEQQMMRIAKRYMGEDGNRPVSPEERHLMTQSRIALRAQVQEDTLHPKAEKAAVEASGAAGTATFHEYKFCVRGASFTAPMTPAVPKRAASAVSANER